MGAGKGVFSEYPKHVFLILGNEFCERFSFYGMKAILVLFLTRALNFSDNDATAIYHGFNVACYFMPVFGAMIADGYLGKYKTIFIISIVYAIGNVVMAVGAIPMDAGKYISAVPFIGLVLIAVGTGGIKPCVSAFGADQFEEHQVKQKETFFSMFYMAINLGSLLSMVITPILRSSVYCFNDNCYALAFGIPAILMVVAVVFFIAGSKLYTKHPPGNNVIGNLFGCIGTALKGKCGCSGNKESREHWLDYADSKYPKDFITDVKAVMRVLFMFLPLPIFWALFDQQGSRWTLQAGQMNGDFGGFILQPDLIQVFNPLLVVLIVPLLESVIFPCLDKLRIPNRPLQRLGLGMFLAGTAFIITAFVQISVDNSLPPSLKSSDTRINVLNTAPCNIDFTFDGKTHNIGSKAEYKSGDLAGGKNMSFSLEFKGCNNNVLNATELFEEGKIYNLVTSVDSAKEGQYTMVHQTQTKRADKGQASVMVVNALPYNITFKRNDDTYSADPNEATDSFRVKHEVTTFDVSGAGMADPVKVSIDGKAGAVYTVVMHRASDPAKIEGTTFTVITPNSFNMLWQIPQYFTMSLGECFFSVTGLSFAYSQAPPSMKAVLQAAWLLTNSFGNLIVMVISAVGKLPSQTAEFFLFAGLMYVTVIIFAIMSITFKYNEPTLVADQEEEGEKKGEPEEGYTNMAMTQDEKPPTYEAVAEAVTKDTNVSSTYM